jgi:hypothetical protein
MLYQLERYVTLNEMRHHGVFQYAISAFVWNYKKTMKYFINRVGALSDIQTRDLKTYIGRHITPI